MKIPQKWAIVPLSQIEDVEISIKNRYSISESILDIFPEPTYRYDTLERDGLGLWHIVVFAASDGDTVIFGNAADEDRRNGAFVWTSANYSLERAKEVVRELIPQRKFALILSD